ncbi:GTPase HflX [Anaerococcus hydrogenalis]|uniref:GTPase HflX n=2 Tax=Anaerococcus hydrogenalis TaxID=33029 RepID=A0A2N6UJK8_9FIRM|nr:GTPase HflX [Anaerococcus hydrogenalis]MBS5989023.1 GTPase HflX [Anaerococcus hydrogenalis]MDK7695091.1 GTPase HflX [Anaerococcus hydrogenalis]MDK7696934.1 GTPase HflX [Anaerococcus hydrogenalis]MDK7708118.1 GTPase HflX [Anaerococcus hydrogenalis]PMC81930.1 GTPase HflX [Anaerococcus hydrogenalis]
MQEVIQVNVFENKENPNKDFELESLINTAGGKSVAKISQVVSKVNPAYYIGSGKVSEIEDIAKKLNVNTVVFDVELSASQLRNLEERMKLHVVDWTTLILDIFAQRANTKEAKLKIKLAQLKYQLPRINKWFAYLSRQSGGIGTRGPGETMLETDKRAIVRDIRSLEEKLKDLEKTKVVNRKSREKILNISLLGYTNAGKSTILNNMLKIFGKDKFVYSDDLLFATLDTSTRRLDFSNTKVTLTDTVGFIDNLSKELNDSFLTTLEEIKFSDMLLVVIDSSYDIQTQLDTIDKALDDIDIGEKKILYVFNKIDKIEDEIILLGYKNKEEKIYISARDEADIIRLKDKIVDVIKNDYVRVIMKIPYEDGKVLDYIMTNYDIDKKDYDENSSILEFDISKKDYNKYERYIEKN